MATLTPVDFDPFASAPAPAASTSPQGVGSDGVLRLTVTPRGPQPKLTPVDYDPFAPKMGVAEDVGLSALSGVGKGVAGLVGLPDSVNQLADYGVRQTVGRVVNAVRSGGQDWSADQSPRPQSAADALSFPSAAGTQRAIETVTGEFHKPQTTAGQYAQTAGEFLPGAAAVPVRAVGQAFGNMLRYGVAPGITSEGAGQATKGTAFEAPARIAGGLFGAGAASLASRPGRTAQIIRDQMPEGVTPQMVDSAQGLIVDAAQQGIALSWPEALSQVAGRPVLTNTMRHLEASPQTEARMAEFFGRRPQEVDAAAGRAFDTVTPAAPNPSAIGPIIGESAEGAINNARGIINRASEPFYNAAAPQRVDPATMARIQATPGWQEARNAVRNDPQLNRYVANLPDDSVGFLNEVKKYLDTAAENAAAPVNQARNMQRSAGYSSDAAAIRSAAENASPDYAAALTIQREGRERFLEPLLQGPLGKLANKDQTTQRAINALFPRNPLPNSASEIDTAVRALAVRHPTAARQLVRAHMESVFNESSRELISGANSAGGAKFRVALVGNPQQAANLEAAVRALPHGDQVWPGIQRFLDVLEATGTRQHVGSRTAYNEIFSENLSKSGMIGEGSKALANPFQGVKFLADKFENWKLGRNLDELARVFTDPKAANLFRAISKRPVGNRAANQIAVRIGLLTNAAYQH